MPNIPFWSFGEGLPVVQEGTTNPRSLGYAYGLLARMLKHRLQWNDAMRTDDPITDESSPEVVNQVAERAFSTLSAEYAELAPRLFTRLVLITPTAGHDARRRVAMSEFNENDQAVIKRLVDTRLLSVTQDDGDEIVEIARDTTLRYWERLKKWIEANREFLLWRQKLDGMIAKGKEENHQPAYLLRGINLETALKYVHERSSELTADEIGYVFGSNTEQVQRRWRRFYVLGGVLALVIVVLTVTGIFLYKYKSSGPPATIILRNATNLTLKNIYMNKSTEDYGADRLSNSSLGPNGELQFAVPPGITKLKVFAQDGVTCEWERIDVVGGVDKKIDIINDDTATPTCKLRLNFPP